MGGVHEASVPVKSRQKKALRAWQARKTIGVKGSDKVQQQFLGQEILTHRGLSYLPPLHRPQLEKSSGLQVTAQSVLTRGPY